MNLKGSLPLLVLHILSFGPCHGYQINKQIHEASDGTLDFQEGTLYPTLHTLARDGAIESQQEQTNGRKRRVYRLTDAGRARLEAARKEWEAYRTAVDDVLGGRFAC